MKPILCHVPIAKIIFSQLDSIEKLVKSLLGVASVINHTSELFAYFFLHELIHRFGHIKILYLGLVGNFVRFVYISIISNPWWVLPFEFIQGKEKELFDD